MKLWLEKRTFVKIEIEKNKTTKSSKGVVRKENLCQDKYRKKTTTNPPKRCGGSIKKTYFVKTEIEKETTTNPPKRCGFIKRTFVQTNR